MAVHSSPSELHNRVSREALNAIVRPMMEANRPLTEILVVLESVAAGVILAITRLGGDEVIIDTFAENLSRRLAELRLGPIDPAGRA